MPANPFASEEAAHMYAEGRPDYSQLVAETIRRLTDMGSSVEVAVDVGSGTGISTMAIATLAETVVGVEPSHAMLERAIPADNVSMYLRDSGALSICEVSVRSAYSEEKEKHHMGLLSKAKKAASKVGKAGKSAAKATKNAAKKVGGATTKVAKKTGRFTKKTGIKVGKGAASIGEGTLSVAQEIGNRAIGLPEAGLNALGVLPMKKVRLRVVVLAKSDGESVLGSDVETAEIRVQEAIDEADTIFRKEAKVKIVPAGDEMIKVDTSAAPPEALDVRCNGGALKDDLGDEGLYFRKRMARNAVGTILGAGAPVTAFVVKDVLNGKRGCSLGPMTDYVTVDVDGITLDDQRTLAHELGHALGLPHTGGTGQVLSGKNEDNLMTPSGHGKYLNKRQVITVRNSRHVTFL